jgi:hypothetical protein
LLGQPGIIAGRRRDGGGRGDGRRKKSQAAEQGGCGNRCMQSLHVDLSSLNGPLM